MIPVRSQATASAAPAQRYKLCPTCRRLTPAESPRCYECWNDVAAVPALESAESERLLRRQVEADAAVRRQRVRARRLRRGLTWGTFVVLLGALAWVVYDTFIYAPPPVPRASMPTLAVVSGPDSWPIDGGNLGGTRATEARTAITAGTAWTADLGAPPATAPVADAERVYLALTDGRIVAVNARDGRVAWEHALPNPPFAPPTVAGGRLYVAERQGRLLVLDVESGAVALESEVATASFATSPMVADGMAYVFGIGELVAFDAATGKLLWSHDIRSNWAFVSPVLEGRYIAVAGGDKTYSYDRFAGRETYYYEFQRAHPYSIVMADGKIYSLSSRFGAALDVDSRRAWWERWRTVWNQFWLWGMAPQPPVPPSDWVTSRPPQDGFPVALGEDGLFVAGPAGDLRALHRADGSELWRQQVAPIKAPPVLAADGLLVVHPRALALYDPADGHLLTERPSTRGAELASAIVTRHGTYAVFADGVIEALR